MDEVNDNFLCLYDKYSNDCLRLAFSFTKNIFDAEDIVQTVFIKLYKKIKKVDNHDFNKNWLLKVTANECKNNFKLVWRRKVILNDEIILMEEDLNYFLKNDDLSEEILKLSLKYRNVIYLHYYEGYKIDEIADILSMKSSSVKTLLSRGREKLKKTLREDFYE